MNSNYFTEEHELFRKSFRDFLQKEVVPHIEKWEKTGTIERFIWKKFGEMGFFGINYPEAYGGMNLDLFYSVVFLEELQKVKSSGFAAAMWAHAYLAMTHLNAEGSERIKQDYLAPSIAGEKIGALCVTEPFGGSDVAQQPLKKEINISSQVLKLLSPMVFMPTIMWWLQKQVQNLEIKESACFC